MRRVDPIHPVAYGVALVLAGGALHPYAIVAEIAALDLGVEASRATIYRVVDRMEARGWITEVATPDDTDPRRRCFQLTHAGRVAVQAETTRMLRLADYARGRGLA